MEADSTTYEGSSKSEVIEPALPFNTCPGNLQLYNELISNNGEQRLECQLVERLQGLGLMPSVVRCPTAQPDCKVICRTARVIDRVQWICEGCSKRQPIRVGSFFYRLQCSILQTLQLILAWCEDADLEVAAAHFGVKPKVATQILDKLDELAINEQSSRQLGGENSVVLAEMYPDCVNRLSPDTTDQPHVHRILMLADTNHIPTSYWLHVIRDDNKKTPSGDPDTQALTLEVQKVLRRAVVPGSLVVTGNNVPPVEAASSIQQLLQHCDVDMQHFLSSRMWRQALSLCVAARSVCGAGAGGAGAGGAGASAGGAGGAAGASCAAAAQRYLCTALHRRRHDDGFFGHTLTYIAAEYTDNTET